MGLHARESIITRKKKKAGRENYVPMLYILKVVGLFVLNVERVLKVFILFYFYFPRALSALFSLLSLQNNRSVACGAHSL